MRATLQRMPVQKNMRRDLVQMRALPRGCWGWRLTAVPGKCHGVLFAPYRLAMLLWKGIALRLGFLLLRKWCGARAPPKQRGIADWLSDWESLGLDLTAGKGSGATLTKGILTREAVASFWCAGSGTCGHLSAYLSIYLCILFS